MSTRAQTHIPFFRPCIGTDEIEAAVEVLRSGWLTTGPKCAEFEQKFAEHVGGNVHAIAVNSATAGLHLAAEACGIGPGDAVLVPTLTFTATAAAFRHVGAEIILVDVRQDDLTIDLEDAERKMTPECVAIAPVHFGGWPCDMKAILAFAQHHGLRVIEDAAHALPAHRGGQSIGSWGSDACVFSFYANKTITTGEGGMVTTVHPEIAARIRAMRTHGFNRDTFNRFTTIGASWSYDILAPGFKYNLTDLAAAIGIAQLERVNVFQAQRQKIARHYSKVLADLPVDCPITAPPGSLHAWHLYPIRIRPEAGVRRDEVIEHLSREGIGTSVHYRPLHRMTYWRTRYAAQPSAFPVAEQYFEGAMTLPLYPDMRRQEVEQVSEALHKVLG
ncbi:MAG TPA: DegT/DnrJ/EryC1/StrS family aminotransferase [Methylovirgula sp.]|nr:DegT/DnrJ/EryC1/StrS family aminotransferase [Methylovirgula sp.]